jgi:MYXO-CTERM domain-containing protein
VHTGYGDLGANASSGCGCTTAGSDQTSGLAGLGLMGVGFAFLGLRRNKKES